MATRLAIVNRDKCRPYKCSYECEKYCPPNRMGKLCIEIREKAQISAELCIGCGQCEKVCPFNAIKKLNYHWNTTLYFLMALIVSACSSV